MSDRETIQYYDATADSYASVAPHGNFITYRNEFIRALAPQSRVLDLGCGGGHASVAFLGEDFDVVPLDGSVQIAKVASKRIGVEVLVKDFYELDFESEFDGVWAAASLTHVPESDLCTVLTRVSRSIREKGLLVASFKQAETDWRDIHNRLYGATNANILADAAEGAGLGIERIDVVSGTGRTNESSFWLWMFARPSVGL